MDLAHKILRNINVYKYASGKQEIQLNIFKNKFFNSGGITGGFTNFAANRVGIGRIIESSASVLLSTSRTLV